jgi:hypothetical protein
MDNEFKFQGTDQDGGFVYTASHEIWNVIKVTFPPDYFHGMEVPDTVNIDITIPSQSRQSRFN